VLSSSGVEWPLQSLLRLQNTQRFLHPEGKKEGEKRKRGRKRFLHPGYHELGLSPVAEAVACASTLSFLRILEEGGGGKES